MKFTLTLFICSMIDQQCYTPIDYPKVKESFYHCIRDGLGESYEYLFTENNFTVDTIEQNKLYATYVCAVTGEEKI